MDYFHGHWDQINTTISIEAIKNHVKQNQSKHQNEFLLRFKNVSTAVREVVNVYDRNDMGNEKNFCIPFS